MQIVLGRGNSRQVLAMPTAREVREMAKNNPAEHVKIKGNLMALIRRPSNRVKIGGKMRRQMLKTT